MVHAEWLEHGPVQILREPKTGGLFEMIGDDLECGGRIDPAPRGRCEDHADVIRRDARAVREKMRERRAGRSDRILEREDPSSAAIRTAYATSILVTEANAKVAPVLPAISTTPSGRPPRRQMPARRAKRATGVRESPWALADRSQTSRKRRTATDDPTTPMTTPMTTTRISVTNSCDVGSAVDESTFTL